MSPEGLQCAPCWKKSCPYDLECIQMIDLEAIVRAVEAFMNDRLTVKNHADSLFNSFLFQIFAELFLFVLILCDK